jgi:RND family efflux transporter MFP subunit
MELVVMFRPSVQKLLLTVAAGLAAAACSTNVRGEAGKAASAPAPTRVSTAAAVEEPIARFLRVTGTLLAEEESQVAAETSGRVVTAAVERGTRVARGGELISISPTESQAQVDEAQANAAQMEARLGIADGSAFDVDRVPEVASARASDELAKSEFERAQMLFERKLLSKSDFDTSRVKAEAARRQYEISRNNAVQSYQSLMAARARLTLARKALADTVVRAPFDGVVGQRLVASGDYVTKGTKVASVLRTNPLRVELTVPEQYSSVVAVGRPVSMTVDAYPGQTFTGHVRYVSPAVRADSRSLVIEAVVPNDTDVLKPGSFATAQIEQASRQSGILVPVSAVRTVSGTPRVFVVTGGSTVEERIVTTGQTVGDRIEIGDGLKAGETVATSGTATLADGMRVTAGK